MHKIFSSLVDSVKRVNRRQATIYLVIVGFMSVTVGRVANYTGSFEPDGWRWLGWLYAISVDVGIIICARFTEWKTTRLALPGFILLVLASGALSIAHVEPWLVGWGAWVYALLPTVVQALLGFLARDASKFAKSRSQSDVEKQLRADLKETRAELKDARASVAQFDEISADLEETLTAAAQLEEDLERERAALELARTMLEPSREAFDKIRANGNGQGPTNAREVNRLLNDCGYYSVPDSTARAWVQ